MIIQKIKVKNFRSLADETIDFRDLTVFVGDNDVGKSNVLRALNLFFNGKTDGNAPFNFDIDFNHNAQVAQKKAKEISIELTIIPPSSYQGSKYITWRKVWRKQGKLDTLEIAQYSDGSDFAARSKVATWLSRIKFKYVPAIKGNEYFSELMGELHDCLSNTVDDKIKSAAKTFTQEINRHTSAISANLEKRLKIKSSIQLPNDLKGLFVSLDFQTDTTLLSLKQRGDGIKARHIPIILRFLADQDNFLRDRGSPSYTHIWGYEEPENNLELTKAFGLAKEFSEYSTDVQILLTTHSPAFYQLHSSDAKIYYLSKLSTLSNTVFQTSDQSAFFDELMGAMPLITPYVNEKVREYEGRLEKAKKLADDKKKKPTLFLEGPSDVEILTKAFQIFNTKTLANISIKTNSKGVGAGTGWVYDMLVAWLHNRESIKAGGLFDADTSGKEKKKKIDESDKYGNQSPTVVKTFKLKSSSFLAQISKKGISLEVAIEEMLDISCWHYAHSKNWLEPRPNLGINNPVLISDMSKSIHEKLIEMEFSEDELLVIKNRIKKEFKLKFSKYVANLDDAKAKIALQNLERNINEISEHFNA
jgi:hypothetical protein